MSSWITQLLVVLGVCFVFHSPSRGDDLQRKDLVAWCIVPFDSKERGPEQRAKMLVRLGLKRIAYDWRQKHVADFEEEILQYKKHGLEYFAFWGTHPKAFELFEKHQLKPQIWMMFPAPKGKTPEEKVRAAATGLPVSYTHLTLPTKRIV